MDSKAPKKLDKKNSKTNLSLQKRQKEDNVKRKLKKLISSKNAEISLNDSSEFQFTSKHAIQSRQTSDVAKACRNKETEEDNPKDKCEIKKASEPVKEQQLKRCSEPVKDQQLKRCSEPVKEQQFKRCSEPVKEVNQRGHGHTGKVNVDEITEQSKSIKSLRNEGDQGRQSDETYSLCTVCNQKFSVSQLQSHQIQCLKDRFQAKKPAGQERERTLEDKEENEFVESHSEETVSCQFCNKDLTKLNSLLKNQHVSNCMDKIELQNQKGDKENPAGNSAFGVFDCPICGKVLKTERARKIHTKRCSQNHGITTEDGLKFTNAQTGVHVKTSSKKMPSKFDEDLQMAIAMSKSMKETDSNDPPTLQAPVTKKRKQTSRKGKKQLEGKEPVLLLLQDDEKQKRLSLKVAAMLLPQEFGSDDDSDDNTPCDDCTVKIKCTSSEGMDTGIDTQVKSFWTRSALDEDQTSQNQKKVLFYVESLMPPITVSEMDLSSKTDRMRKMSCDQKGSQLIERMSYQMAYLSPACPDNDSPSVGDIFTASTQTAVNLALLETDDQDQPECTTTDINCSGFCPEKMINIPEDITRSVSSTLKENLSSLVDNSDLSDIEIVCENKTINAHRIILAVRCPSFLQIVTDDPAAVRDETYEVILSVLKFIYAGEISLTKSSLIDVKNVADRMGITELVEICETLEKDGCIGNTENQSYQTDIEIESLPSSDSARTKGKGSFQNDIDLDLLPSSDSARSTGKGSYQNDIDLDLLPSSDSARTEGKGSYKNDVDLDLLLSSDSARTKGKGSYKNDVDLDLLPSSDSARTTGKGSYKNDIDLDLLPSSDSAGSNGKGSYQNDIDLDLLPSSDSEMDFVHIEENEKGGLHNVDSGLHNLSKADSETEHLHLSDSKNNIVHKYDGNTHSLHMSDGETDIVHVSDSKTDILQKENRKMDISTDSGGKEFEVKGYDIQSSYERGSDLKVDIGEPFDLNYKNEECIASDKNSEESCMNSDDKVKIRSRDSLNKSDEAMDCDEDDHGTGASDNNFTIDDHTEKASLGEKHNESAQKYTEMCDLSFGDDSFWTQSDLSVEDAMNRTFEDGQNQPTDRKESPYRTGVGSISEDRLEVRKGETKVRSGHLYTDCDGYQEKDDEEKSPSKSKNELGAGEVLSQKHQYIGSRNTSDSEYTGDGINLTNSFNASSPPLKIDRQELDSPVKSKMSFEKKRQKDKTDKCDKQESSKTAASSLHRSPKQKVKKKTSHLTKVPSEEKGNSPVTKEFSKTPKSNTYAKQGDSGRNFTIPSPFTPMPTYDKMNTPSLKKEMQRYGVKPVGKKRMIMLLKDIYHKTHEYETDSEFEVSKNDLEDIPNDDDLDDFPADNDLDILNNDPDEIPMMDDFDDEIPAACDDLDLVICDSDVEDDVCTASQESDRSDLIEESYFEMGNLTPTSSPTKASGADLSQKFRQFISDHEDIHTKLLLCEPLELDLLKKQMTEKGIKCSMEKLMDFLDEMCITFTMKNSRSRVKRKKKATSK